MNRDVITAFLLTKLPATHFIMLHVRHIIYEPLKDRRVRSVRLRVVLADLVFSYHALDALFRVYDGDHLQIVPGQ